MTYDSPDTLQELCLDVICDKVVNVFELYYETVVQNDRRLEISPSAPESLTRNVSIVHKKFRFKDGDVFLFNELSERLLERFGEKKLLCDSTLNLFGRKNTRLRNVRIRNPKKVTADGLRVLRQHKVVDLECVNVNSVHISKILDCLSEWSIENLTNLNLSKCTFIDMSGYSFMVNLTHLKNLRSLNVSYTELNQQSFQMICEDLKFLEKLNISGTVVQDLSPLLLLSEQLVSITVSDLKPMPNMASVIAGLSNLRHLDISLVNEKFEESTTVNEILENRAALRDLLSLDISGWREFVNRKVLTNYIECHPKLRYLGIVLNHVAFEPVFCDQGYHGFKSELVVAGLGSEEQIKVTLHKHYDRPLYVQKALYHLFQLTGGFQHARPDIFELVLSVMASHPTKFGVQMASTACMYNLTRGDFSKQLHPKALSRGVQLTLNAMEYFPKEYQLQKNSLLTLCSDHILQEVNLERFRCVKLVLDSLCAFEDVNMNRMAAAICSILAARVSTAETSELGARPEYMRKLLAMVQSRVETQLSDITMKFTLSALWNLTDESAATCTVFLELGGAVLFLNVLKTFRQDSGIETKVLGLLNNIAEVERLRHSLMLNALVEELHTLLRSEHIDVSYFAAGIVAHLASDGRESWTVTSHSRSEMLEQLRSAIVQWRVPECEMVAYRSFKPFFPLLRRDMEPQVQLWAVWAINHVCTKNPKRYCQMLRSETGLALLKELVLSDGAHPEIRHISSAILDTLDRNVT